MCGFALFSTSSMNLAELEARLKANEILSSVMDAMLEETQSEMEALKTAAQGESDV